MPGQKTLPTLLDLIGISKDYLDVVVYHAFHDVNVTFDSLTDSIMTWTFDDSTKAVYTTKNSLGEKVHWAGFPSTTFSHCTFVFEKRNGTLQGLVKNASKK